MTRASRRKFHIIYKTTCTVTGRWYIGMHSTDDLNDEYLGSGRRIISSIKKHGRDKHIREILEQLDSRDAASNRESELITKEMRADPQCMNCGPGGLGATDRPATKDETRKKLSEAGKKVVHTKEWHAKIGAANKGKTISPEVAKAQSERMTGYKWKQEHIDARVAGQKASAKFKERYKPLEVDGVRYDHAKEAVEKLGIAASTLRYRIMSPSWESYKFV